VAMVDRATRLRERLHGFSLSYAAKLRRTAFLRSTGLKDPIGS
jgi:hypothetical protein